MNNPAPKYQDCAWDFRTADTKEFTHCFHAYPAMMIPQIARELLRRYGQKGGWLLDPYCGTGTSLVEASLFGMHSVGCDINPLVRLIATSKLTPVSLNTIDGTVHNLDAAMSRVKRKVPSRAVPEVTNLNFWFADDVIARLAFLRSLINDIKDSASRNFAWVAFSETVREASYTRKGEFKLYRMPPQSLENFSPDVFSIFSKKLNRNRQGLGHYLGARKKVNATVLEANSIQGSLPCPMASYDLVITSPPYGDSQTTVAYGQYSRLSAEWIGLPHAKKIDRLAMGGGRTTQRPHSASLTPAIEKIAAIDAKRAAQVADFYVDLEHSINSVAASLSPRATVCYVVGNRRVKGITLPTDEFVVSAFAMHGFAHKHTIVRSIPNKRMPAKNSPSNIVGNTAATMHRENIVVCQRK
ncbi:MAG: DNA methyltransferase [Pseudomonadota bacterium]|nr:DNA methyltransferase [Pseudomonadota bacterium]